MGSVGVCLAASLIWAFSDRWLDANGISYWYRFDPICTLIFSVLVLWTSIGTIREALRVLMAGVPVDIDCSLIEQRLLAIPSVIEVHDMHVWSLTPEKRLMWAHLTLGPYAHSTTVLYEAQQVARDHNVLHTCFQLEDPTTYDKEIEPCF